MGGETQNHRGSQNKTEQYASNDERGLGSEHGREYGQSGIPGGSLYLLLFLSEVQDRKQDLPVLSRERYEGGNVNEQQKQAIRDALASTTFARNHMADAIDNYDAVDAFENLDEAERLLGSALEKVKTTRHFVFLAIPPD